MNVTNVIEEYLSSLYIEGKSPTTVAFYQDILRVFTRWLRATTIEEISTSRIREYLRYLQTDHVPYSEGHPLHQHGRRLSPYTVKGHWATLSAFFSWLEKEELLTENPMRRIARPKVPTKIKAAFAAQEIRDLLKACDAKWAGRGIRDRAMILFLLDTGCRVSELCGVPLADVDFPAGRVKVKGKGAKERFVYISQTTARVLLKYVHEHRPQTTAPHLFLSHEGQPLNRYSVASLLYRLGAKAGVPHVHAHRFRHTAAIQFLRNGSDIFHLQRMLGHTTLEMVKTYVALADADVARAHQKASPVENWGLR